MKIFAGLSLLLIGLFLLATLDGASKPYGATQHPLYQAYYGITGNEEATLELLKCYDEKNISHINKFQQLPKETGHNLEHACLEDWIYSLAAANNF